MNNFSLTFDLGYDKAELRYHKKGPIGKPTFSRVLRKQYGEREYKNAGKMIKEIQRHIKVHGLPIYSYLDDNYMICDIKGEKMKSQIDIIISELNKS